MNFLAHLYLSGASEGLIIGNFIGDSVKGQDLKSYETKVRAILEEVNKSLDNDENCFNENAELN